MPFGWESNGHLNHFKPFICPSSKRWIWDSMTERPEADASPHSHVEQSNELEMKKSSKFSMKIRYECRLRRRARQSVALGNNNERSTICIQHIEHRSSNTTEIIPHEYARHIKLRQKDRSGTARQPQHGEGKNIIQCIIGSTGCRNNNNEHVCALSTPEYDWRRECAQNEISISLVARVENTFGSFWSARSFRGTFGLTQHQYL